MDRLSWLCVLLLVISNGIAKEAGIRGSPNILDQASRVLVTGAAGFVGFHLSSRLTSEVKVQLVIGIDDFNVDYPVEIKRKRAKILIDQHNILVKEGNICDRKVLVKLFQRYSFTHIIHAAGHTQPWAECFSVLVDEVLSFEKHSMLGRGKAKYKLDGVLGPMLYYIKSKGAGADPLLARDIGGGGNSNVENGRESSSDRKGNRKSNMAQISLPTVGFELPPLAVVYGPLDHPRISAVEAAWRMGKGDNIADGNRSTMCHSDPGLIDEGVYSLMESISKGTPICVPMLTPVPTHTSHSYSNSTTGSTGSTGRSDSSVKAMSTSTTISMLFIDDLVSTVISVMKSNIHKKSFMLNTIRPVVIQLEASHTASKPEVVEIIEQDLGMAAVIISSIHAPPLRTTPAAGIAGNDGIIILHERGILGSPSDDSNTTSSSPSGTAGGRKTSLREGLSRTTAWYKEERTAALPCECECSLERPGWCFPSGWATPAAESARITQGCRTVIYTVAIGANVRALHHIPRHSQQELSQSCSVAFVSDNAPVGWSADRKERLHQFGNWVLVPVASLSGFHDTRKASRVPKISPGRFFAPSVEYAVYVDNKLVLKMGPAQIFSLMHRVNEPKGNRKMRRDLVPLEAADREKTVLLAVRHPIAVDVYKEAYAVLHNKKRINPNDPAHIATPITFYAEELAQQVQAYHNYQDRFGMAFTNVFDGAFLVHNLHNPAGRYFRCKWYAEYSAWSDRDVVAGAYAMAQLLNEAHVQLSPKVPNVEFIPIVAAEAGGSGRSIDATAATVGVNVEREGRGSLGGASNSTAVRGYVHVLPSREHWYNSHRIARVKRWEWN